MENKNVITIVISLVLLVAIIGMLKILTTPKEIEIEKIVYVEVSKPTQLLQSYTIVLDSQKRYVGGLDIDMSYDGYIFDFSPTKTEFLEEGRYYFGSSTLNSINIPLTPEMSFSTFEVEDESEGVLYLVSIDIYEEDVFEIVIVFWDSEDHYSIPEIPLTLNIYGFYHDEETIFDWVS